MKEIERIRGLLSKIHGDRNMAVHAVDDRDLNQLKKEVKNLGESVDKLKEIVNAQIEEEAPKRKR